MPSVALLKPASNQLEFTGGASPHLGTGGTLYYVKTKTIRSKYTNPMFDSTGDGDVSPFWEGTNFIYGVVQIQGWMLAAQNIGIINMITDTAGGLTNDPAFTLLYWLGNDGAYRGVQHECIMKSLRVSWRRNAALVGVAFTMVKNGKLEEVTTTPQALSSNSLGRPKARTAEVLVSPGTNSSLKMGTTTTDDLVIKLHSAEMDFSTDLQEDTGDGDLYPHFAASMFLNMRGKLRGLIPAGSVLGLDYDDSVLTTSDGQSTPLYEDVQLWLEADGTNTGSVLMDLSVESYRLSADRSGPFVPIELSVRKQSDTSGAETFTEAT